MYAVFEGIDGCGKSTQWNMACKAFASMGMDVEKVFEPSRGEHGQALRKYIAENPDWSKRDNWHEARLFHADRMQLAKERIWPAMAAGKMVLSDRSYLSSVAYQGARGILPVDDILTLNCDAPKADVVILFDLDVDTALGRIDLRSERDGFENKEYLKKVRRLYLGTRPKNTVMLDGSLPIDELAKQVMQTIMSTTWTGNDNCD